MSSVATPPAYEGSVVIIWLSRQNPQWWQPAIHDADTNQLIPVTAMFWGVDFEATDSFNDLITVDLRLLVDNEGRPLIADADGRLPNPIRDPDDPDHVRTRIFRCRVAEIRTAP